MSLLAVSTGLSLASSVLGFGSSRKAKRRQREAEALAARRSAIANIHTRRAAAASLRRTLAQQQAIAIAQGAGGSSASFATAASSAAQHQSAVGNQLQQINLGAQVNSAQASANSYASQAQDYAAIGSLIGQGASLYSSLQQPTAPTVPGLPNGNS